MSSSLISFLVVGNGKDAFILGSLLGGGVYDLGGVLALGTIAGSAFKRLLRPVYELSTAGRLRLSLTIMPNKRDGLGSSKPVKKQN